MQYFTKSWNEQIQERGQTLSKIGDASFWKDFRRPFDQYQAHFDAIKAQLPSCVQEDFVLHDCQIMNAFYDGGDLVIEFDHTNGFTKITEIRFVHCPEKNIAQILHTYWIYEEFHLAKKTKYKVGILLGKGNRHMIEFIVPCDDIIVSRG